MLHDSVYCCWLWQDVEKLARADASKEPAAANAGSKRPKLKVGKPSFFMPLHKVEQTRKEKVSCNRHTRIYVHMCRRKCLPCMDKPDYHMVCAHVCVPSIHSIACLSVHPAY